MLNATGAPSKSWQVTKDQSNVGTSLILSPCPRYATSDIAIGDPSSLKVEKFVAITPSKLLRIDLGSTLHVTS